MPGDPTPDLATERQLLHDIMTALANSSVKLLDIEAIRLTPEFQISDTDVHFEICQELGARYLVVGATDRDRSRLSDNFAALAERARTTDIVLATEFAPYMALNTLQSVVDLVDLHGSSNVSVPVGPPAPCQVRQHSGCAANACA